MKNFIKILILVLSLMLIVSAFTVISLATDEELPSPVVKYENDFESYERGKYLGDNSKKVGFFGVDWQDGSDNKYLLHYGCPNTGTNASSFLSGTYSYGTSVAKTNIADYPYAVFEFDIMKPTAEYSIFSIGTYIKNEAGAIKPADTSVKSTALTSLLPEEAFEWAKVTVIFKYHSETVDGVTKGYLSSYAYVNGVQAYKYEKAKTFTYDENGLYNEVAENGFYLTDLRLDTSTTTNTDSTNKTVFDNVKLTVYPASYTMDKILGETYYEGYTFPYTKTSAIVNDIGYESVEAALAAAKEGDTVYLREDASVIIDKAINVETKAVYLENLTEVEKTFAFDYKSYTGYVPTVNGTTYSFAMSEQPLAEVYWDYCDGNCDCYFKDAVSHVLTNKTLVPVGQIPQAIRNTPVFEIKDGLEITFKGWSYTKGATKPDELVAITENDAANGLKLYPVYEIVQYTFEVISSNNESTYYVDGNLDAVIQAAPAGATIKLHADVTINKIITFGSSIYMKSLTIDLNGFALTRMQTLITQYAAISDGNGGFTKGDALGGEVTTGTTDYLFYMKGYNGHEFTIKSSRPGAILSNLKVTAEEWVNQENGKVVNTVTKSIASGGGLVSLYPALSTFNIYGENIEFFIGTLFYGEHGSNNASTKVNIDGGTYYINAGGTIFPLYHGGTHTIKNATFFCSGGYGNNPYITRGSGDKSTHITFDNCNILGGSGVIIRGASETHEFNNCRIAFAAIDKTVGNVLYGDNTIFSKNFDQITVANGCKKESVSYTETYVLKMPAFIGSLDEMSFTESDYTVTYVSEIANAEKDFAKVTWTDPDGEILATVENAFKSNYVAVSAPTVKIPSGDGFRAYTNPVWLNDDGTASNLVLGSVTGNALTFKASMPENPEYVGYITDALFSLAYYGHFGYNIYVPDVEGVTYTQIGDYKDPNYIYEAKVDGVAYKYANAGWIGPANAIKEQTKYVKFYIDGVEYAATFKINAMVYAEILCSDPNSAAIEKEAIINMMDYIEEAYKASAENKVLDQTTQAKFDNFFENYNSGVRPTRITNYPESSVHTINADFAKLVKSISFGIYSGNSRYATIVTLTKEAVAAGYSVKVSNMTTAAKSELNADGTATYYTNNVSLSGSIMSAKFTVSVLDSDGKTVVASTDYSLATYITGVKAQGGDTALAEALYNFGSSVIKVRSYLATK